MPAEILPEINPLPGFLSFRTNNIGVIASESEESTIYPSPGSQWLVLILNNTLNCPKTDASEPLRRALPELDNNERMMIIEGDMEAM